MQSSEKTKEESWHPFSYVINYINNYHFVDTSKTPPIVDPKKRSAIAEKAKGIKDKVRETETQLTDRMLHNEKKVSIFGGSLLTVGIALIIAACLIPYSIPFVLAAALIGGLLSSTGTIIGAFGITGLRMDKNQKDERANYFEEMDTKNSKLINQAVSGLKSTKQESLSHSEMIKVMGAPSCARQNESQLDARSKSSTPAVEHKSKNQNEVELVRQPVISDKRLRNK